MEIPKTDVQKTIAYLEGAAKLYEALPGQQCACRAHMIRQLIKKYKERLSKIQ